MTDPVAQAAAQIASDAAPAEPSIFTEIVDEFKHLGEKIEHMIHPETTTPGEQSAAPSSNSQTIDASATGTVAAAASASGEPGNASAGAEASATVAATTDAPAVAQPGELTTNTSTDAITAASAIAPENAEGSTMGNDLPNAASTPPAGAATPADGDAPNVATGAAALPETVASALGASIPTGIVGIVESSVDKPVVVAQDAAKAIRTHLTAIKNHLSIRGFELSAVADIHTELDAIEKWL